MLFTSFAPLTWAKDEVKQEVKKVPFRVPNTTSTIKIDGKMDDEAWKDALMLEIKYENTPGDGIPAGAKTEVFLISDEKNIYACFKAYDPNPEGIRAHMGDHDELGHDDWVGLILDTFNDNRRAFEFFCNPFGVQGDMIEGIQGGGHQWDGIWASDGRLTEYGYMVEMRVPFSTLRFPRKKTDQIWGLDLVRLRPREHRYHYSLFVRDRSNNCYLCQTEKLIGFAGVSPGKNIEIDPTLSALYSEEREDEFTGDFIEKEKKINPGITFRWGFSNNLTLSATINPDFSNVEADVAQLDVNNQFALFYPEKRPFFLEGSTLFNSRFTLIHTRSLVEPDWGVKITGKEGSNAIGFFSVQDAMPNLILPGSQGSRTIPLNMTTLGTALRYRRDVGKASTVGLVLTDREGDEYHNRVAGFDGDFTLTRKDRVRFQVVGSQTLYPEEISTKYSQLEDQFTGAAFDFHYYHNTRSLDWYLSYKNVGKNFRTDLGFMPQVDYRLIDGGWQYTWQKRGGAWYTKIDVGSGYEHESTQDDTLLSKAFTFWFTYNGPSQSFFNTSAYWGKQTYLGLEFDKRKVNFSFGLRPSNLISLSLNGIYGDQVDFANAQLGTRLRVNPVIDFTPGRYLKLSLDHVYEYLDVDAGRLYTANLTNLKLVYQFSRRVFVRAIIQYADNQYDETLYPYAKTARTQDVFTQFLFSYKINPQTVLFLGYSDNFMGYDYLGFHQGVVQLNRAVFLKIGYALLL